MAQRDRSGLPAVDSALEDALHAFDVAFTISDPTQADHPIVFASSKFYELTGYTTNEVLGRNCRFLQGPETERRKVTEIRDAIREHRPCQVCILNYKKNGERFWNQFHLSPLHDEAGHLVHYVGIQADVTSVIEQRARPGSDEANNNRWRTTTATTGGTEEADGLGAALGGEEQEAAADARTCDMASWLEATEDGSSEVAQREGSLVAQIQGLIHAAPAPLVARPPRPPSLPVDLPCSLVMPLLKIQQSFVLADPRLPDTPIVHVSDKFLELTGYGRDQVVGRNCRFLQGPGTDPAEVARLRAAVTSPSPQPITVRLLNYTAGGRPFWNLLHIAPIRGSDGAVMFFAGIQLDVSHMDTGEAAAPSPAPALTLSQKMAHQGVTGAIRVAVRSLGGEAGLRRSLDHQTMPHSLPHHSPSRYAGAQVGTHACQ
uniref:Putative LOV domain-containing protein n=1 Tax=Chlamydomonas sp. BC-2016 TaxID=1799566 RepID=A0A126X3R5_9CHLO|nr:putative LOV domain-containing protein [Chlamydomonas sp. BC-2016]